jgi:thiamine pyrophosphokinase
MPAEGLRDRKCGSTPPPGGVLIYMHATIFANGDLVNARRAMAAAQSADMVIAADGGVRHCTRLEIRPAVVIGDLDSLTQSQLATLKAQGTELIHHPADKDETDLELALLHAVSLDATRITLLGASGDRLDMTVSNLLLLADPRLASAEIELWYADQTARVLTPPGGRLAGEPGDTLSLIPLGTDAGSITTHDLEFALEREHLALGPARGVSNRISGPMPTVEFRSGLLLAVHTPKSRAGQEEEDEAR